MEISWAFKKLKNIMENLGETWKMRIAVAIDTVFGSFGNEPMQSCSVHHVVLSSVLSSSSSSSSSVSSVYSPPSDSLDYRNFISYKYMYLYP